MGRDMSVTGVLIATSTWFDVGEKIALSFRLTPEAIEETTVFGKIVRSVPNAEDPSGMWTHHYGVEFYEPFTEVDNLLEEDRGSWSPDFLIDMESGLD